MPPQLREIGFHVENHATQWHGFQHEIQFQEVVVAWIQLTLSKNSGKFTQLKGGTKSPFDFKIAVKTLKPQCIYTCKKR